MMSRIKKITLFLLSAAAMICMLSVSVSAKSKFSNATTLEPMQTVSEVATSDNSVYYYKLPIKQAGIIQFSYFASVTNTIALYDSDGDVIIEEDTFPNVAYKNGDNKNEKPTSYSLDKGTYYLKLTIKEKGKSYNDFHYSFEPDKKPTVSLKLTIKKGDIIQLGTLTENYSGSVKWKTSNSSVVAVSKGKIKGKATGSAKIRAYIGSEYIQIKVYVKD